MKSLVLFAVLCILGVQSKELCLSDKELENLSSEDAAVLNTPKCTCSLDVLQVGMMIQRFTNRPQSELIPAWLNLTLIQEGRQFANKNFALLWFSNYMRAILAIASDQLMPWLPYLEKGSTEKVAKTLLTTSVDTLAVLAYDPDTPVDMDNMKMMVNSIAFEADNNAEALESKKYTKIDLDENLWKAVDIDLKRSEIPKKYRAFPEDMTLIQKWQIPLNQFSLALGQYSLVGISFTMRNISGLLNASPEEEQGWLHLWAVLGHIIGIEDNFNVALQKDAGKASEYYQELVNTYLIPSFFQLRPEQKMLIEAVLKISTALMPVEGFNFSSRLNMVIFLQEFLSIETPKTSSLLNATEKASLVLWQDLKGSLTYNPFLIEGLNLNIKENIAQVNYLTKYIYSK